MAEQDVQAPVAADAPASITDLRNDVKEFYRRGLIDADRREAMLYEINMKIIASKSDLVADLHEAVHDQYNSGFSAKQRKEQHALAQETLEELELPDNGLNWEGEETWSTKIVNTPLRKFGDFLGGFVPGAQIVPDDKVATHGTHSQRQAQEQDEFLAHKREFAKSLLASNTITEQQYNELVRDHGLLDPDKSLLDIMDVLGDEFDVSDGVIEDTLKTSTTATFRRRNREMEALEEAQAQAEGEESLLSSDDKINMLKSFERLEKVTPGKYVFDESRGRIYEVGTGQLVDEMGEVVDPTSEEAEGIGTDDLFWEEAGLMVTPWDEYQIEEDSYYGLIDVVNNPGRYHAGGIERFASGEQFIGGFAADYGVAQAEEVWRAQNSRQVQAELQRGGLRAGMMSQGYSDNLAGVGQEVRRPWYDQGDNWALYAGKSPEAIAIEQQKLVAMGALEGNDIVEGQWGPAEASALQKMMTVANGRAEKIEDIDLDFWNNFWTEQSSGGAAAQRRAFVAPTYQKLDPARAQLTIEDTVRRLLGRDATEDELADLGVHMADMHRQSFAADVQALQQEYNAETRAIDTDTAQAGGEVQDVDWEARFQTAFNERNAAELDRFDRTQDRMQRQQIIGGAMNSFMQTLGGGIGGGSLGGR